MFFKKLKKISLITLLAIFPFQVLAYSSSLIASGETIGIKVSTDGVLIVGTYDIDDISPAKKAGLKSGDIITKIDENIVLSIDDMIDTIDNKEEILITYKRNSKEYKTKLSLIKQNGISKTGLYVKDSVTGIGTLTYIDPQTKEFGALGHEIQEKNTKEKLEIKDGKIFESNVISIDRSSGGTPGAKNADFNPNNSYGEIKANTECGIFGTYTKKIPNMNLYKVANFSDIKLGSAKIRTVVENNTIKDYEINILKVNKSDNKNILFEITDEELLNKTGGVVQGMSGSPIIQDDYIIGAVNFVIVDTPNRGYGIFIKNMLEEKK